MQVKKVTDQAGGVRRALVERARRDITLGRFETTRRLSVAVDRLIDDVLAAGDDPPPPAASKLRLHRSRTTDVARPPAPPRHDRRHAPPRERAELTPAG